MLTRDLALAGRYRIDREIGRGGMAHVYRGTDEVLGRTVAVKVLNPEYASDPTFVERFRREARAAAGLNHPNVVAVFDTGSDGDLHFIVMEFVEGSTLAELLAAEGPLDPGRAAGIAASIADALSFAHANGLVHRDVKPANVMITPDGHVKVMDFGIARLATSHTITQTSTVFGTAAYLAPEQAQGERVDGRADVYALGVVLYEMLTGRVPFVAETPLAVASKHVFERPEPPSAVRPGLPEAVESVAMRALEKDPAERYPDAAGMAAALRSAASGIDATVPLGAPAATAPMGGSTEVLPPVRRGSHAAPRRRPRWLLPLVAALVVLLAAAVVAAAFGGGKPARLAHKPGPTKPPVHASHRPTAQPSALFPTSPPATSAPPTSAPPTTAPTTPGVADALAAAQSAVQDALSSGGIDDHAANDLQHALDEAQKRYDDGRVDDALGQLSEAKDKLAEAVAHQDATPEAAIAINGAIDQLSMAMTVEPPTDPGSPPPGHGPGSGHDHGHGDGNDQGD